MSWGDAAEHLVKLLATPLKDSNIPANGIMGATISVLETLLSWCGVNTESLENARTCLEEITEARKDTVIAAVELENARVAEQQQLAEAQAKVNAQEAIANEMNAQAYKARCEGDARIIEAKAKLAAALQELKKQGGELIIDESEITAYLHEHRPQEPAEATQEQSSSDSPVAKGTPDTPYPDDDGGSVHPFDAPLT